MFTREFDSSPRGFGDLLPYDALVAPGLCLLEDGRLLKAWRFRGPDSDTMLDHALDAHTENLALAVALLDERWQLQTHVMRTPAPGYPATSAQEPVIRWLDDRRRRQHDARAAGFHNTFYLTLTWSPPQASSTWLRDLFLQRIQASEIEGSLERAIEEFDVQVRDFLALLEMSLPLEALGDEGLLKLLHAAATGLHHGVRLPEVGVDLNYLVGDEDFIGGVEPKVGGYYLAALAITEFPGSTRPGILDELHRLGIPYHWSTRWQPVSSPEARRLIQRAKRDWDRATQEIAPAPKAAVRGERPEAGNPMAERLAAETREARLAAEGQGGRFGFYSSTVVLFAKSPEELEEHAGTIQSQIRSRFFGCRRETLNAVEAFLGSLPGDAIHNVRRPLLRTQTLGHLLPAFGLWAGEATCPSGQFPPSSPPLLVTRTGGATPFFFNLHAGDVGHTLVVGATGRGKSTLLAELATAWRARYAHLGARVVIFDKGLSAYPLTKAIGGSFYELASGRSSVGLQPMAGIDEPAERAWATGWLEAVVLAARGTALAPAEHEAIERAVELSASVPGQPRTLSAVVGKVSDLDLRATLAAYTQTKGGAFGELLDADRDDLEVSDWLVFELGELMEQGERLVAPLLLYLFHRIERALDGRPTLLILDEAWQTLEHEVFAGRIRQWLKELRKANGAVVLATQSLQDLGPNLATILEGIATQVVFPNSKLKQPAVAKLYRDTLGLNERELELLSRERPLGHYFVSQPKGKRAMELVLTAPELAFLGPPEFQTALERIRRVSAEDPRWPVAWLQASGHSSSAKELQTLYDESEAENVETMLDDWLGGRDELALAGRGTAHGL